ncbi:hypothetical protein L1887_31672 [Cichorium endivia]|nr:hypothetical protein L1887_31672 [Cichorium endivia]
MVIEFCSADKELHKLVKVEYVDDVNLTMPQDEGEMYLRLEIEEEALKERDLSIPSLLLKGNVAILGSDIGGYVDELKDCKTPIIVGS